MQTDSPSLQILFAKYINGEATPEETQRLFQLIGEHQYDADMARLLEAALHDTPFTDEYDPAWESTLDKIKQEVSGVQQIAAQKAPVRLWPRMAGIAAAVAMLVLGIYFFNEKKEAAPDYSQLIANDIAPGKAGATLTLANGKKIRLGDVANGEIAKESGIAISRTANGQVVYQMGAHEGNQDLTNTLSTSKGETYMLTLPDQSKVWLNAASSLTYNTTLITHGIRKVKLTGEAYFEVAKDKTHPFVVESGNQQVEVLGTHFNVNAYQDESVFRTTLLEGSVKVSENGQTKLLTPGSQAANAGGTIRLSTVDTELAVAWKSNNFVFDRLTIKEIMRNIARWYDVEVIYQEELPSATFWGSVSRFDNVSKVLIPLEATGNVHFKIEGRKIYVSR